MTLQGIAVALIVPLCALVAAWHLMGTSARRRVSTWLAASPLSDAWTRRLRQGAAASACGCDGCDQNDKVRKEAAPSQSIVRMHRRRP